MSDSYFALNLPCRTPNDQSWNLTGCQAGGRQTTTTEK